jgi:hypothetical protein
VAALEFPPDELLVAGAPFDVAEGLVLAAACPWKTCAATPASAAVSAIDPATIQRVMLETRASARSRRRAARRTGSSFDPAAFPRRR